MLKRSCDRARWHTARMSPPKTPTALPVSVDPTGVERRIAISAGASVSAAHAPVALRWMSELHERERRDVAAALHDRIGQAVSAMKMSAHLVLDESDPEQRREDLLEIIRIADVTVAQLRALHCRLRPPQLDTLGLEAALRGEVERLAGGVAEVDLDLAQLSARLEPEVELACLRIAQQLLMHVLDDCTDSTRNSRLRVTLRDHGDTWLLLLVFDRCGRKGISAIGASAWASLVEYAAALGGSLHRENSGEAGVSFELCMPSSTGMMAVADGSASNGRTITP